jgi:MFS family permease
MLCYLDRVSISVAIIALAREKGYDAAAQGLVLSAFFWGYLWTQLAGGLMADRFGGKRILALGVAIWSAATFLTPAASVSFAALLCARALLGVGEGFNFPAIHSLAARWTLAAERARAITLNFSGMFAGTVIAFLASPIIITNLGWRALFYISGALGAAWLTAWAVKAADRPEVCPGVSAGEQVDGTGAQPIFDVANTAEVELFGNVPAIYLQNIRVGEALQVTTDAFPGKHFAGRVVAISPAVDPSTNVGLVRVRIANGSGLLRLGMFLTAQVPLETHAHALVVSPQAIYRDSDGQPRIFRVQGDKAEAVGVKLGIENQDRVELLSGAQEGEVVILTGAYGLGASAQIKVKP